MVTPFKQPSNDPGESDTPLSRSALPEQDWQSRAKQLESLVLFKYDFSAGLLLSAEAISSEMAQIPRSALRLGLATVMHAICLIRTGETTAGFEELENGVAMLSLRENPSEEARLFSLAHMALAYSEVGDQTQAGIVFAECAQLLKHNKKLADPATNDPILRSAERTYYLNLALYHQRMYVPEKALDDAQQALVYSEYLFGPMHEAVLMPLQLVAKLAAVEQQFDKARLASLRLLELCRTSQEFPDVLINTLMDLSHFALNINEYKEARTYVCEAIEIAMRLYPDAKQVIDSLRVMEAKIDIRDLLSQAQKLKDQGEHVLAIESLKEAAQISKLGLEVYQAGFDLGLALLAYKRYADVHGDQFRKKFILADLYKVVTSYRTELEQAAPVEITATLATMAERLNSTYDLEAAQKLLIDAHNTITASGKAVNHPKLVLLLLLQQGTLSLALKEGERAQDCLERASQYLTKAPAVELASHSFLLAQAYALQGNRVQTVRFGERALDILPAGPEAAQMSAEILMFLGDFQAQTIKTAHGFFDTSAPQSESIIALYNRAQKTLEDSQLQDYNAELYANLLNRHALIQISKAIYAEDDELLNNTCERTEKLLNRAKEILQNAELTRTVAYALTLNNLGLCCALLQYDEESEARLREADILYWLLEFERLDLGLSCNFDKHQT